MITPIIIRTSLSVINNLLVARYPVYRGQSSQIVTTLLLTNLNYNIMAQAIFNSLRGEKSALLMVKANPLCMSQTAVYVPRDAANQFAKKDLTDADKGLKFDIPDGYRIEDFVDPMTGEVRVTKDGQSLTALS